MSYQAIETRYLGPTNSRGSRVRASCAAKGLTVSWDDELSPEQNHRKAAVALANALRWVEPFHGEMVQGVLKNGNNVFVFTA